MLVKDSDARQSLVNEAMKLLYDKVKRDALSGNAERLGKPGAASEIVVEIEKMIECN